MRIAVAQTTVSQGARAENLAAAERAARTAAGADLICLPGLFATGLGVDHASQDPPPAEWLEKLAAELEAHLVASFYETVAGQVFETVLLCGPTGAPLARYRRCHSYPGEEGITLGDELVVVVTELARIGLMAGPEIYHPEVVRLLRLQGAEVVICAGLYADPPVLERSPVSDYLRVAPLALSFQNEVTFVLASGSGTAWIKREHAFDSCPLAGQSAVAVGYYEGVKARLERSPGALEVEADLNLLLGSRTFTQRLEQRRPELYGALQERR